MIKQDDDKHLSTNLIDYTEFCYKWYERGIIREKLFQR